MIKGKTSIGFEFEIDERRCNDYRLVKASAKLAKDPDRAETKYEFFEALTLFVGKDIENRLVDYVTDLYGYADSDEVAKSIGEIYKIATDALSEVKRKNLNSSSAAYQPMRMPSSAISQKPMEYTILEESPVSSPQHYVPDSEMIAESRRNSGE